MVYRDEEQTQRCELCGSLLEDEAAERFATLELCRPCVDGYFGDRIAQRGIRVQQLTLATQSMGEHKTRRTYILVNGAVDHALTLQASFSREDLISRLGKLFRPELKVGDPLFDDEVFIRTNNKEALSSLLRSEGLQSLIHRAVSELADHELPLLLEGQLVRLRSEKTPSASASDYLRRVAALLLHHLARDAEARNVALTAPPPLFDLERVCEHLIPGSQLIALHVLGDRFDDLQRLVRFQRDGAHDQLRQLGLNRLRLGSSDLSPLAVIPELEVLSLAHSTDVVSLTGLAGASTLQRLDLYGCLVADLSPLAGLSALHELNLNRTRVRDLSPLAGLTGLKQLFLQHSDVEELSVLRDLTALEWLNIRDTQVSDLGPIMKLGGLKRLDLLRSKVPAEQQEQLVATIPGLQIDPR